MALQLIIVGSAGRMGRRIAALAQNDPALAAARGLDRGIGSPEDVRRGDVVVDFSAPDATLLFLKQAVQNGKPYVIGTTGFSAEQEAAIGRAAGEIPIVKSANMSLGVNVFFKAAQQIAQALPDYRVTIQETHHAQKKDAPSGTAVQAGRLIEKATGKAVQFESFREGEVVGDHKVIFIGPADRLELFHHAASRDLFAAGALQAAKWVVGRKPGLYTMWDVLGL